MSSVKEIVKIKTPPGNIIGNSCVKWEKDGNNIMFYKERPSTPLPPLVQATFIPESNGSKNGILEVCAFVFIAAELSKKSPISVYYLDVKTTPNFYITYDAPEIKSAVFSSYRVTFFISLDKKPTDITTIVWNEDPDASRGTVTTVQP